MQNNWRSTFKTDEQSAQQAKAVIPAPPVNPIVKLMAGYQPWHPYDGGVMGSTVLSNGVAMLSVDGTIGMGSIMLYFGDDIDQDWRMLYSYTDPRAKIEVGKCHALVPSRHLMFVDATQLSRIRPFLSHFLSAMSSSNVQFVSGSGNAALLAIANDDSLWNDMETRLTAVRHVVNLTSANGAVISLPWGGLPHAPEDEHKRQAIYLSHESMRVGFATRPGLSCEISDRLVEELNSDHPKYIHAHQCDGPVFDQGCLSRGAGEASVVLSLKSQTASLPIAKMPSDTLLYGRVGWPHAQAKASGQSTKTALDNFFNAKKGAATAADATNSDSESFTTKNILFTPVPRGAWTQEQTSWIAEPEPFITTHDISVIDARYLNISDPASIGGLLQRVVNRIFVGSAPDSDERKAFGALHDLAKAQNAHAVAVRYTYSGGSYVEGLVMFSDIGPEEGSYSGPAIARINIAPGQHVIAQKDGVLDSAVARLKRLLAEENQRNKAKLDAATMMASTAAVPATTTTTTSTSTEDDDSEVYREGPKWVDPLDPDFLEWARFDVDVLVRARMDRLRRYLQAITEISTDEKANAARKLILEVTESRKKVTEIASALEDDQNYSDKMERYTNGEAYQLDDVYGYILSHFSRAVVSKISAVRSNKLLAQINRELETFARIQDVPDPAYLPLDEDGDVFEPRSYGTNDSLDRMHKGESLTENAYLAFKNKSSNAKINTGRYVLDNVWNNSTHKGVAFIVVPEKFSSETVRSAFEYPLLAIINTERNSVSGSHVASALRSIAGGSAKFIQIGMSPAVYERVLLTHAGLINPIDDTATQVRPKAPAVEDPESAAFRVGYDLLFRSRKVARFDHASIGAIAFAAYEKGMKSAKNKNVTVMDAIKSVGTTYTAGAEANTSNSLQLVDSIVGRYAQGDNMPVVLSLMYAASVGRRGFFFELPRTEWEAPIIGRDHGIKSIHCVALTSNVGLVTVGDESEQFFVQNVETAQEEETTKSWWSTLSDAVNSVAGY
jgi:hypothetical protein